MRLEFGTYVQVFEDKQPTNTSRARSLGAIALNPTGNAQGDYYFLSLASGAKISRHQWTELPMTDTAIARVEALALLEGQPLIQERGLVVEWRPDQEIDESEYDKDYDPPPATHDDGFAAADFDPIDADELNDLVAPWTDQHDGPAQGADGNDDDDDEEKDEDNEEEDNDDAAGAYHNDDDENPAGDDAAGAYNNDDEEFDAAEEDAAGEHEEAHEDDEPAGDDAAGAHDGSRISQKDGLWTCRYRQTSKSSYCCSTRR